MAKQICQTEELYGSRIIQFKFKLISAHTEGGLS
jgi:hypothetical protein